MGASCVLVACFFLWCFLYVLFFLSACVYLLACCVPFFLIDGVLALPAYPLALLLRSAVDLSRDVVLVFHTGWLVLRLYRVELDSPSIYLHHYCNIHPAHHYFPDIQVSRWRMMTRGLMETLEARATWAANKRLDLRMGPSEVDGLEVLRPEVGFVRCFHSPHRSRPKSYRSYCCRYWCLGAMSCTRQIPPGKTRGHEPCVANPLRQT